MARGKQVDSRVRAFVRAMLAELPDDERLHINDIEDGAEALAGAVHDEFASQLLAREAAKPSGEMACPHCGKRGRLIGRREREIATTRGSAEFIEPKCYCPSCRRAFFPEVDSIGPGVGR